MRNIASLHFKGANSFDIRATKPVMASRSRGNTILCWSTNYGMLQGMKGQRTKQMRIFLVRMRAYWSRTDSTRFQRFELIHRQLFIYQRAFQRQEFSVDGWAIILGVIIASAFRIIKKSHIKRNAVVSDARIDDGSWHGSAHGLHQQGRSDR